MTEKQGDRERLALDYYQGALLGSAIGDALGWPTEYDYMHRSRGLKPFYQPPLTGFVSWNRLSREQESHVEQIHPGEYSDDTQLTLALTRCISPEGHFMIEQFAYQELPLWLDYERGGGSTVRTAARILRDEKVSWNRNFFQVGARDYRRSGTNGAAMRNLPLALLFAGDEKAVIKASFLNSIVTHGHPRAILGSILYGLAVHYILTQAGESAIERIVDYLVETQQSIRRVVEQDDLIGTWITTWDGQVRQKSFWALFEDTIRESQRYLEGSRRFPRHLDYYKFSGARHPISRGSGITTICTALFLFLYYYEQPEVGLITAANTFASDTDTISGMLGGLLGAYHGVSSSVMPQLLLSGVQDRNYILQQAETLFQKALVGGQKWQQIIHLEHAGREHFAAKLNTWRETYTAMMQSEEEFIGSEIEHPALGCGTVIDIFARPVPGTERMIRRVRVRFACGQSCIFYKY